MTDAGIEAAGAGGATFGEGGANGAGGAGIGGAADAGIEVGHDAAAEAIIHTLADAAIDASAEAAIDAAADARVDARTDVAARDGAVDAHLNRCVPGLSPPEALLTDFSAATWNASQASWGTSGNVTGKISTYAGGLTAAGVTTLLSAGVDTAAANPGLAIRGNVVAADYAGVVMAFDQCVNSPAYRAVRFTLTGTAAGCDVFFQLQTDSQQTTAAGGTCVTDCYHFPNVKIQAGTNPITITFASLAGTGQPAIADGLRAEIIALQLQLQSPTPAAGVPQTSCIGIALNLDNVQLVAN